MTNKTREYYFEKASEAGIPDYMQNSLIMYIMEGRPTGGFLHAILTNDLKEACNKADEVNRLALYNYVFFLYNYAPQTCWGSEENVKSWYETQRRSKGA